MRFKTFKTFKRLEMLEMLEGLKTYLLIKYKHSIILEVPTSPLGDGGG
jgi:hypothetical protein